MANNPVGWFEIYVDDMARAPQFYETVFGITLTAMEDPTASGVELCSFPLDMDKYGASGALVKMEGFKAGGNSTLVYLWSEDCAVEEAKVVAAGGQIQKPKMSIAPHGFISLAIDTEGNMFGLHSMK